MVLRVFVALGLALVLALSITATDHPARIESAPVQGEMDGTAATPAPSESSASDDSTITEPSTSITTTTVAPVPPSPGPPVILDAVPSAVPVGATFAAERDRAIASGTPGASDTTVIASSCFGDEGRPHWGYFNNGAAGGAVLEPDGAVVPMGAICLNPTQPDPYSSLVHELGHGWFWRTGTWDATAATFGGSERAAECFARYFGATVFGSGGCPDQLVSVVAQVLGG